MYEITRDCIMPPMPKGTVKSEYKPQSIDTCIEADVLVF
jgi:hypothetical protein